MKKRIISAVLALTSAMAIGLAPAPAFSNSAVSGTSITSVSAASWYTIVAPSGVKVRTKASLSGDYVGALAKNSEVLISKKKNADGYEWGKIAEVGYKAPGSWGKIKVGYWIALRKLG